MPINPDAAGSVGEPAEISWTSKQSLMYALGVGAGVSDPTGFELEFTTENSDGITQRALPTMGVVIGGARTPDFGSFNPVFLLHAEQQITCHREIPAEGSGIATGRVGNIYDKGKAALVYLETDVVGTDGEALWSTSAGLFLGGEGGWGGDRGPSNDWAAPDRDPDHVVSTATRNDQALLYRLSGDRNPLHSDPTFAAAACAPMGSPVGRCSTLPAALTRPDSVRWVAGSSPRWCPARCSTSTPGRSTTRQCSSRRELATGWCSTPA
jgi:hypothetical protein